MTIKSEILRGLKFLAIYFTKKKISKLIILGISIFLIIYTLLYIHSINTSYELSRLLESDIGEIEFPSIVLIRKNLSFTEKPSVQPDWVQIQKEEIDQIRNLPKVPFITGKMLDGSFRVIKTNDTICNRYPTQFDVRFDNHDWQIYTTSNGTNFYIYNAYLDSRPSNGSLVRMLGMVDQILPVSNYKAYCQFWYNHRKLPIIKEMSEISHMWYPQWGNKDTLRALQPYLLTCPMPVIQNSSDIEIPYSVSLADSPCMNATTNLLILNNRPKTLDHQKNFAVCVKGLDFLTEDITDKLIEWIELISILGGSKIFFYLYDATENVKKVLDYYRNNGKIDVTLLSLAGGQPNLPLMRHEYFYARGINKRQSEVVTYNDCLYRNLYNYKFVTLLDIDEVIVPMREKHWKEMMIQAIRENTVERTAYCFQNIYYLEGTLKKDLEKTKIDQEEIIPKYFHILRHITRSVNYTREGHYVKCFHNTKRVIFLHNHFPLQCYTKTNSTYCWPASINVLNGRLQHYRKDCVTPLQKLCATEFKKNSVVDKTVWRFGNQLKSKVIKARKDLGFII